MSVNIGATDLYDTNCQYRWHTQTDRASYADVVTSSQVNMGTVCGNLYVNASNKASQLRWGGDAGCPASETVIAMEKLCL